MEFVDIAGLVEGASKGEGLGNQFRTNIRETDAIVHVVRAFENDDVVHVSGKVSPIDDMEIINTELVLADLASVEKLYEKALKNTKSGQKEGMPSRELIEKILPVLEEGHSVRSLNFNEEEIKILKVKFERQSHSYKIGNIISDKSSIKICILEGFINLIEFKFPGKKQMDVKSFLNGFSFDIDAKMI